MSHVHNRASCGLDVGLATDLEFSIEKACSETYDFISTAIVDLSAKVRLSEAKNSQKIGGNTSNDFILNSQEWSSLVIARISSLKDLNSDDNAVRISAEDRIMEELDYASFLGLPAVMIEINENINIACASKLCYSFMLRGHHSTHIWVKIPVALAPPSTSNGHESNAHTIDTWQWWNKLRNFCGNHVCIKVVLQVTSDLPNISMLSKWCGEPVRALSLPTSIFLTNKKGYPVLSKAHQHFIMKMFKYDVQVVIEGQSCHMGSYRVYQQYMDYLYNLRAPPSQYESFSKGYEDYLQAPLQPLMDNLESSTYEIFEKDPIKYDQYENAVFKCLLDRVPEEEKDSKVSVVMVLGAGRGPILRMALKAARKAKRKVKCYAVEKNRNAAMLLRFLRSTEWSNDDVTIVTADMRHWDPPEKADIIVSELLGSFGDNELSPECLDGANRILKPDGVSIPQCYTSYLLPISSQKLYNEVKSLVPKGNKNPDTPFETPYVVRIHNYHELTLDPVEVFTFCHPNWNLSSNTKPAKFYSSNEDWDKIFKFQDIESSESADKVLCLNMSDQEMESGDGATMKDVKNERSVLQATNAAVINSNEHNSRHKTLKFEIHHDTVLHGFAGYFRCALYKDIEISIEPNTHSPGMFSWFPIFFPLKTPIPLTKGCQLEVEFWRCCNEQKVWYEWAVSSPQASEIHNPNGRSYIIGL